jgi:hypothetical protein
MIDVRHSIPKPTPSTPFIEEEVLKVTFML